MHHILHPIQFAIHVQYNWIIGIGYVWAGLGFGRITSMESHIVLGKQRVQQIVIQA